MTRSFGRIVLILMLTMSCRDVMGQRMQQRERDFADEKPHVGDMLPDVTVYNPDGSPFRTSDLRGHFTVLTFGCMTCPPSLWNISGLEAVHRDYHPKGVRFYFIYKALAHPELAGHYVQPFTIDERLAHARQAKQQLGTQIPWIVDAMDNRLKHAMGDRPNSQFLIDPQGMVVHKRAWSNPQEVRADLEELVGRADTLTTEKDLDLRFELPKQQAAATGVVPRLKRPKMMPLVCEPFVKEGALPFYAKLRVEADAQLLEQGTGNLYLGFHLDPFHQAHWNNLTEPLSWSIEGGHTVQLAQPTGAAEPVSVASDADPREFLIPVAGWPEGDPLELSVTYYACVGDDTCHAVRQTYTIYRKRDTDGGGARGAGAGYWDAEEFVPQLLSSDRNKDGKLQKSEAVGLVLPHFEKLDADQDDALDAEELKAVVEWLNHFHRPAPPAQSKAATSSGPPVPGPELLSMTPEQIEAAYAGQRMPEAVAMYLVIVRGGQLDGTSGWFGPAQSRYSWEWLAERCGVGSDESISQQQFGDSETLFRQLDRDRDGTISRSDLDWSDDNPWVRQSWMINRMFRRIDPSGDGHLTQDEWLKFFEQAAGSSESVRFEQLRDALIPPAGPASASDFPRQDVLIRGLMAGEIGSLQEGPEIDQSAPDFLLHSPTGGESIRLSDRLGNKPIVLVFGNFTCGPFRSLYATVEAVRERQKENADFLMIYVREAHPEDGWAMKSNTKAGIAVVQPKTLTERQQVAQQCAAKLRPSMPLLVDDISDTVGNAYSGMPARLYVIDPQGRVVYKSGRGPFGFKPEEMEQALVMCLLEQSP